MSHNYLLDTYTHIAERLAAARQQSSEAGKDQPAAQNAAGRIEALSEFEKYLSDNFDDKLPRRLARERKKTKASKG